MAQVQPIAPPTSCCRTRCTRTLRLRATPLVSPSSCPLRLSSQTGISSTGSSGIDAQTTRPRVAANAAEGQTLTRVRKSSLDGCRMLSFIIGLMWLPSIANTICLGCAVNTSCSGGSSLPTAVAPCGAQVMRATQHAPRPEQWDHMRNLTFSVAPQVLNAFWATVQHVRRGGKLHRRGKAAKVSSGHSSGPRSRAVTTPRDEAQMNSRASTFTLYL